MRSLKVPSLLAACIFLFTVTSLTHAAGESITIGQMSRSDVVGEWMLELPGGGNIKSSDTNADKRMHTLKAPALGTYTLIFDPPRGAKTTVDFTRGTDKISSSPDLSLTFTLHAGETLRIIAEYAFEGSIRVQSDPSGVAFVVTGPQDIVLKGKTPAQFSDLPPFTYTAYFTAREGCVIPRPQKRELETPGTLIFNGTYFCTSVKPKEDTPVTPASKKEPTRVTKLRMEQAKRLQVMHTISQRETLPGGDIAIILRVQNPSNAVIRNIDIFEHFDPNQLSFRGDLPRSPRKSSGKLTWTLKDLQPNETWTVTLKAHVNNGLKNGERISLSATAKSTDLIRPAGMVATVDVVTELPKTGGAFDQMVLVLGLLGALGLTKVTKRA